MGIVNILHTVNPASVLLSGGMIAAGELLMRPVRETVDKGRSTTPGVNVISYSQHSARMPGLLEARDAH